MLFGSRKDSQTHSRDPAEEAGRTEEVVEDAAEDADIRGGPPEPEDDSGFFDSGGSEDLHDAVPPDAGQAAGGPLEEDVAEPDLGGGPGDIRFRYPDPEPFQPEGPDQDDSNDDPDGDDDIAGSMARGSRPAKKSKQKRDATPAAKPRKNDGNGGMFASEAVRRTAFTCGCVTAGFCCVLLVIFGTIFVCQTFRVQPKQVLANPDGNVYYDSSGRMHVNIYMQREPDTEITVYILPDGTATTEKPSDSSGVRTVVMYVDENGNITDTPPDKTGSDHSGDAEPEQKEPVDPTPESHVFYLDQNGQLQTEIPKDGPWRPVTVLVTQDGQVSVIPGEPQGVSPDTSDEADDQPAVIPALIFYILGDGTVTTEDPGEDGRKVTIDLNGETPQITQEDPPAKPAPDPDSNTGSNSEQGTNSYAGMTEAEILAQAEQRRQSGNGWYLDSDEVYIIQKGDTLGVLSGRFGFSVDFLAGYNAIQDKNLIITGESLRYPAAD